MDMASGALNIQSNPFFILTFIVAPAILTNASALMIMSTSNRFARAVDRARDLSRQIEDARKREDTTKLTRLNNELLVTEKRAVLLMRGLRAFYFSLGGFALAAFVSLVGAGLVNITGSTVDRLLAVCAVISVFLAVSGLIVGSVLLISESRITVGILQDRIRKIRQSHELE